MATHRPEAIIFDVNDTLFDFEPLRARFVGAGLHGEVLDVWLARVLRDGFAHAAAGTFASFTDLAGYHLDELCGREWGARILDALHTLRPHPDVEAGLARIRAAGDVRCATLTDGTVELTTEWLDQSGLRHYFESVFDAADALAWKPRATAYVHAVRQLGADIERTALVSVHPWDIHGATCAGMIGAWLNRRGARYPAAMNPPQVEAATLSDLAGELLELPRW